eukprot:1578857-Amphidinium_carterae.1
MLGVKCRRTNLPLKKPWRVATTHGGLVGVLRPYRCDGTHAHGRTEGGNTKQTGFYPRKFAEVVINGLRASMSGSTSVSSRMVGVSRVVEPVEKDDPDSDDVMIQQIREEFKNSGLQPFTCKEVDQSTGADREEWAEAMAREMASMSDLQ